MSLALTEIRLRRVICRPLAASGIVLISSLLAGGTAQSATTAYGRAAMEAAIDHADAARQTSTDRAMDSKVWLVSDEASGAKKTPKKPHRKRKPKPPPEMPGEHTGTSHQP